MKPAEYLPLVFDDDLFWLVHDRPLLTDIVAMPAAIRSLFPGVPPEEQNTRWTVMSNDDRGLIVYASGAVAGYPKQVQLRVNTADVNEAKAERNSFEVTSRQYALLGGQAALDKALAALPRSLKGSERLLAEEQLLHDAQAEMDRVAGELGWLGVPTKRVVLSLPSKYDVGRWICLVRATRC